MRPWKKRLVRIAVIALVVVLFVLLFIGYALWEHHHRYPYGVSHCCDLCLHDALQEYATSHGGAFPSGEATPEASLSLLYREERDDGSKLADEVLLRGKTVPAFVVKEILERGQLLTPETCGCAMSRVYAWMTTLDWPFSGTKQGLTTAAVGSRMVAISLCSSMARGSTSPQQNGKPSRKNSTSCWRIGEPRLRSFIMQQFVSTARK